MVIAGAGGASVLYVMSEAVLQVHERRFNFFCVRVAVEMLFVFKNSWINSRFPVVE